MEMNRRQRKFHQLLAPIALALIAVLAAAPTTLAARADVYGVGGGSINLPTGQKIIKFAFSAHDSADGDFGSARFTIEDPNSPLDFRLDIDCVNVGPIGTGAGGWAGGEVTKVTPDPNVFGVNPGDQMMIAFNDFGNPSGLVPDEFNGYFGAAGLCDALSPSPQSPISQGNINVKLGS
jgi:hypothetical protein